MEIISYADWDFYNDVFLIGRPPQISENLFPFYIREASRYIDKVTFLRVRAMLEGELEPEYDDDNNLIIWTLDPRIPHVVSEAACAIAEILYAHNMSAERLREKDGKIIYPQGINVKLLNGFEPDEMEEHLDRLLNKTVEKFLAHTGLLFRGIT